MTILEYAERQELYKYFTADQKEELKRYQEAKNEGKAYMIKLPLSSGKTWVNIMINRYEGYLEGMAEAKKNFLEEIDDGK